MKVRFIATVAALASVLLAGTASAATNLLTNGDFEVPAVGSGYYNVGPGGDNPTPAGFGWTVSNGNVDLISYSSYPPAAPSGGLNGLDLVGYGSTGTIDQSFATTSGQKYLVTFNYSSNASPLNSANVLFNNAVIGTVVGAPGTWQTFTGYVFGTGGSDNLAISELVGGGNAGVFLDNISVSAVPETATWAMMLIGFGGLGAYLRMARRGRAMAAA